MSRDRTAAPEPAFLRRLKQHHGSDDAARHGRDLGRPQAPKRLKMAEGDEDEDAPTYVDGQTNDVISSADYKTLIETSSADIKRAPPEHAANVVTPDASVIAVEDSVEQDPSRALDLKVAAIGERRKRRAARVVGDDDNDSSQLNPSTPKPVPAYTTKARKKVKKSPLSFDDED